MRAWMPFLIDQLIPAALTAGLNLAPRFGYFTLLPLSLAVEREYGNYALLLGSAGALVASASFCRVGARFNLPQFAGVAVAGLVTVTPFVLGRAGITLGLPPRQFDVVITFAYLGFFIVVGVLVGGCWSIIVKALRDISGPEWPQA